MAGPGVGICGPLGQHGGANPHTRAGRSASTRALDRTIGRRCVTIPILLLRRTAMIGLDGRIILRC